MVHTPARWGRSWFRPTYFLGSCLLWGRHSHVSWLTRPNYSTLVPCLGNMCAKPYWMVHLHQNFGIPQFFCFCVRDFCLHLAEQRKFIPRFTLIRFGICSRHKLGNVGNGAINLQMCPSLTDSRICDMNGILGSHEKVESVWRDTVDNRGKLPVTECRATCTGWLSKLPMRLSNKRVVSKLFWRYPLEESNFGPIHGPGTKKSSRVLCIVFCFNLCLLVWPICVVS